LVVDDDPVIRSLMTHVLQKEGYRMEHAANGQEAVELFARLQPDLVLMDAMMPVMTGFEACKRIRQLPGGNRTPLLIITSLQDNQSVEAGFEAGAADFITKPVHWAVLRRRVQRLLEARRAEDELYLSETRYRSLFEDSPVSVWELDFSRVKTYFDYLRQELGITDLATYFQEHLQEVRYCISMVKVVEINNETVRLFEAHDKAELLTNLDRILDEELPPMFTQILMALSQGKTSFNFEGTVETMTGRQLHIWARASMGPYAVDMYKSIRFSVVDLTDRKLAEVALRRSEERFRQVVASISDCIYVTEFQFPGHRIIHFVSPHIKELTGFPAEYFTEEWGQWLELMNPEDHMAFYDQLRQLDAGINSEVEYRLHRADGQLIWVRDSARVEQEGERRLVYGVMSDITERKHAQDILMASQKLADLGTLAAGVAHEINSPLQVITGVSQSLIHRLDHHRLEEDLLRNKLEIIHRNGWRCAEIVRSLKTYAHISEARIEPVDLNEIVKDSLLLIEHQLISWDHIQVLTSYTPDLPPMYCDRNQISQIVINLLTNARDAMSKGGDITIATSYNPQTQEFMLQVSDTGVGIPEAIQVKMFDPFFTTKPIDHGVGLGLSIIAGIVRAHNGKIEVESTPGQGAIFTLRFPNIPDLAVIAHQFNPNGAGRFDRSMLV
jgi:PAS domain S-box-containing protein